MTLLKLILKEKKNLRYQSKSKKAIFLTLKVEIFILFALLLTSSKKSNLVLKSSFKTKFDYLVGWFQL